MASGPSGGWDKERWRVGERVGGAQRKLGRIQRQAAYLDFWWLEHPLVEQGVSAHIGSCNTKLRRGRVIGDRVGDSERVGEVHQWLVYLKR